MSVDAVQKNYLFLALQKSKIDVLSGEGRKERVLGRKANRGHGKGEE
jgi:hypothetical protein